MKNLILSYSILCLVFAMACSSNNEMNKVDATPKHHLNIPPNGIETLMEANTSKIIEGNEGSVIVTVGEVTRKKADISIKRNDRILDEKLISEGESITFDYQGLSYVVKVKSIKKPLIGAGKVEITITQQ